MAKADQRENDHVPKQPGVDPSLLADMEEPATAKIRALLRQGVANAGMFAKIVHENPQAKGEIVALLNNAFGNGFTTKVVEISEVEDSPRQGKPPVMSPAAREELNDGAYSSDGTTGRRPKDAAPGTPQSANNRAEAMELFREVNGGPDKGGDEKRAEEEQPQPQEQELAKVEDQQDEKRAEEEQPRPQEQELAKVEDQQDEKRAEEEQPGPQEQELARVEDQQDEKHAGEEQEKKRHRLRTS